MTVTVDCVMVDCEHFSVNSPRKVSRHLLARGLGHTCHVVLWSCEVSRVEEVTVRVAVAVAVWLWFWEGDIIDTQRRGGKRDPHRQRGRERERRRNER